MEWNSMKQYIDYTNVQDYRITDRNCEELVLKARVYGINTILVSPASINACLPHLKDTDISLAVSIAYPSGAYTIDSKLGEIEELLETYPQVSEFYVVLAVGQLLDNNFEQINSELAAISSLCQGKTIKVMTELQPMTETQIDKLCTLCKENNIKYLVTSTGFKPYDVPVPTLEKIKTLIKLADKKVEVIAECDISSLAQAEELLSCGVSRVLISKDIWMEAYAI